MIKMTYNYAFLKTFRPTLLVGYVCTHLVGYDGTPLVGYDDTPLVGYDSGLRRPCGRDLLTFKL